MTETRVYYPPDDEAVAQRLADELGVGTTALLAATTRTGSSSSSAQRRNQSLSGVRSMESFAFSSGDISSWQQAWRTYVLRLASKR